MENHMKRSSSGEIFSFPSTLNQEQDSDFEFGCFTLDSPSLDPYRTSLADHLFFKGRLLPHSFPIQPATTLVAAAGQISPRGTSRTSSINSKDSMMSSRSNSSNSRSSSSSARTSSSENSDRRFWYHYKASKIVSAQIYGDSQRWQYVTAMPVLKREVSTTKYGSLRSKKQSDHQEMVSRTKERTSSGSCLRILRLFLLVCRECHALEPSKKQDFMQPNMCGVK